MENLVVFKTRNGKKSFESFADSFEADQYGINTYFEYENMTAEMRSQLEDKGIELTDFLTDEQEVSEETFNSLNIRDEDGEIVTFESLGDRIVVDDSGNKVCGYDEYISDNGKLDIDGEYHNFKWKPIADVTETELQLIIEANPYNIEEFLIELNYDVKLYEFLKDVDNRNEKLNLVSSLFNGESFQELVDRGAISFAQGQEEDDWR